MARLEIVFAAVNGGNLALVKSLLDEDANLLHGLDDRGFTLLHVAVEGDFKDIAEYVIQRGIEVNEPDSYGYRPLHLVKSKAMAELLISKGADVNLRDNYGLAPLHNAVLEGYREIMELLIARGADINAVENKGFTPLKMAVKYKLPELEEILKQHGARE